MKRREFLKRSTVKGITALTGASLFLKACHTEEDMIGEPNWVEQGLFDRPLPIPSVANKSATLKAQRASGQLLKGKMTEILSYGTETVGPTIQARMGESINVSLQNELTEDTNIHWHGLILPENMEGHPKDVTASGASFHYSLPINQRAGTYWYHPHAHGSTASQVFMGLVGMFIVNDDEESMLNLPSGEFEIPLIIQDKHFDGGKLDYSPTEEEIMTGYLGEQIVVNGLHAPFLSIESGWYRLRILNASTARVYNLGFTGGIQMNVIGADGGLLTSPETVSSILVAPGERIDVLVDFTDHPKGKEVYLVSNRFSEYNAQGRQSFNLLKFKIERTSTHTFTLPHTLSHINSIDQNTSVKTRTFDISGMSGGEGGHGGPGGHSINGKTFDMHRIDETVQAGTTEIWEFDNMMGDEIHPMHIHSVQFQLLHRMGGRNQIIASEKGWKDTVLVMPGEKVQVIMTFPEHKGVFVLHCHNLEHEDDGMMLNFRIV
jgi:blue copper oxidase